MRKLILISLMSILLPVVVNGYQLPNIGSASGGTISTVQEKELGIEFMQMVRQALPLLKDPVVVHYIQTLGHHLVQHSPSPHHHFYFFVVEDSAINAFAGPGGYVAVNTGLILSTKSEGELAAVMSHEISHVTQRHIARMIGQQKSIQLANLAALVGAIAIGSKNPEAGAGLATAAAAGSAQTGLNFSRGYEREADEIGMQTLAQSGYSPRNMPLFFARLENQTKLNESADIPEILLTHPLTASRLADAENRSQFFKIKNILPNNPTFYLIQSRIIVDLTNNPKSLAAHLKNKIQQNKTPPFALQYAYALACAKANKLDEASRVINALINQYPQEILYKITQANILQAQNQSSAALSNIQLLYQQHPKEYLIILAYANLLVANKQYSQAVSILEKNLPYFKQDENYLDLLSTAQAKSGELSQAYETRANLYLLQGNPDSALIQLQQALQFAKDRYARARIQYQIKRYDTSS